MRNVQLAGLIFLLLAGCRTTSDPSATAQRTPGQEAQVSPSAPSKDVGAAPPVTESPISASETHTALPAAVSLPDAPLSEEGPWWIFHTYEGIWAGNPDGSGLTLVLDRSGPGSDTAAYLYAPTPAGGLLALIEIEDQYAMSPPLLRLLSIPQGQLTPIAQLHPQTVDPAGGPQADDRWVASGLWNAMAWSPDGQWLAFNAVIDGPSGDLYVYSVERDEISRLSDGPTETVFPVWSPDGERIVHGAVERLYFGYSGAGYDYSGLWSAGVDGSAQDLLFATAVNGFEEILGWLSSTTMLLDTNAPNEVMACSYRDLRTMDVISHEVRTLVRQRYMLRAYDPQSATLVLAVTDDPSCPQELASGIYWVDVGSGAPPAGPPWPGTASAPSKDVGAPPLRVVEDQAHEIAWSPEAGLFFVSTQYGALAVDTAGQFIDLVVPEATPGLPLAAPGSKKLAWTGDELWVGTLQDNLDQPPRRIHPERIWDASWSLDGRRLLFMAEDGFFVASEPEFTSVEVIGLRGSLPVWVLPRASSDWRSWP